MTADLFDRAGRWRHGYDRPQVEDFFARARRVWAEGGPPGAVTSWHVRTVGFDLRRNGYRVAEVDRALDRIEDAFAAREDRAGVTGVEEAEQAVLARLDRGEGERFPRARLAGAGYRVGDVDRLCARVGAHLRLGRPLTVDDVRTAVFRRGRGAKAYREAPVDAHLDRVVDLLRRRDAR